MHILKNWERPFTNRASKTRSHPFQDAAAARAINPILREEPLLSKEKTELHHPATNATEKNGMKIKLFYFIFLFVMLLVMAGCTTVKPWEKGLLGDPIMMIDSNPLEKGIFEHHLDYREGSVGGTGAQSGGCGCG